MSDTLEKCGTCDGSGTIDSGGVTPWGQGIDIPCPECQLKTPETDKFIEYAVRTDWNWRTFSRRLERQRDAYAETLREILAMDPDWTVITNRHPELGNRTNSATGRAQPDSKSMNDIDALPVEQQRLVRAWASRLKRLVKDAPHGIVAVIGNGSTEICTEDELQAAFDRDGDLCGIQPLITVHETSCFRPYGESM